MIFGGGQTDAHLTETEVRTILTEALPCLVRDTRHILVIIPDATRTAPVPLFFRLLFELLSPETASLDFLVALGTHPIMSEQALQALVGISASERNGKYRRSGIYNHRWDLPEELITLDTIAAHEVHALSGGRLDQDVPVTINRRILDYDLLLICGPTYPHEVVGFSGGHKYFFPGISGPDMIHITHWLGALLSCRTVIGRYDTPVRAFIDRAAQCIPRRKLCASLVVRGPRLHGLFVGPPKDAWRAAARLSSQLHIQRVDRPHRRAFCVIPPMYQDLWTGAKGMYKLESVIADGGEVILYAPHIKSLSHTHEAILRQIGYHGSEYFLQHWDRFKHFPWAVLAHSVHVRGQASFEDGMERPRIRVTLASRVPRAVCERLGLGYLDPDQVDLQAWQHRHDTLFVPEAGECLYLLQTDP